MNIETANLVLNLDAESIDSYLGSGAKWYDLVHQDHYAFLVNNPAFDRRYGGCFDFNGKEYVVSLNLVEDFIYGNNEYSIEVWFKTNKDGTVVTELGHQSGLDWFCNQVEVVQGKIYIGAWTISGIEKLELTKIIPGEWQHVIMTYDGSVLKGYVNGKIAATKYNVVRLNPWSYSYGYYMALGYCSKSHMGSAAHFRGAISSFRLYNTSLGPEQVEQNYLATKERHAIITA